MADDRLRAWDRHRQ